MRRVSWLLCLAWLPLSGWYPAESARAEGKPAGHFEWRADRPEAQGLSSARLEALKKALAARGTKALLVIRNDRVVCEWYAAGHSASKPHYTASMAKALVAGVSLAVAVGDGRVKLDDPAARYVPAWERDRRKARITLRHLGSHTSGLDDAESGEAPHAKLTGWRGDFWKRLDPPDDPFTIARDRVPLVSGPGRRMRYSNPGIAMLTYAVTAALRDGPQKDVRTLLRDRVMRPIGVRDAEWSVGYGQTFQVDGLPLVPSWGGGSYTPRAVARVARLMLREGDWEDKRLIPARAVRRTTRDAGTPGNAAMGWWSNNEGLVAKLPRDAFWGAGAGHQVVLVVPSLKLIAVRNGEALDAKQSFDEALRVHFFEPLMGALSR